MRLDSLNAYTQNLSDLFGVVSLGDQPQDLALAGSQPLNRCAIATLTWTSLYDLSCHCRSKVLLSSRDGGNCIFKLSGRTSFYQVTGGARLYRLANIFLICVHGENDN